MNRSGNDLGSNLLYESSVTCPPRHIKKLGFHPQPEVPKSCLERTKCSCAVSRCHRYVYSPWVGRIMLGPSGGLGRESPSPIEPGRSTSRGRSFDLALELLRAQFSARTPGKLCRTTVLGDLRPGKWPGTKTSATNRPMIGCNAVSRVREDRGDWS